VKVATQATPVKRVQLAQEVLKETQDCKEIWEQQVQLDQEVLKVMGAQLVKQETLVLLDKPGELDKLVLRGQLVTLATQV
jgi:hypothetical protein